MSEHAPLPIAQPDRARIEPPLELGVEPPRLGEDYDASVEAQRQFAITVFALNQARAALMAEGKTPLPYTSQQDHGHENK